MSFPRYERYTNAGSGWLGHVPTHWQVLPNKACLRDSNRLVGEDSSDFTLLSLTLSGVIVRDVESGKGKFPAEFDTYKAVEEGDLILCLFDIDETPRTVGLARQEGMITGAYEVLRCRPNAFPLFLYYFYLHVDAFKGLRPWYTGLRKVVRPDTFMSIKLALPLFDEQKAIGSFLDHETAKIDGLIEEQRRLIELLKEKRQAVISHAVTKGLNPDAPMKDSGVDWIGNVPKHWEVRKFTREVRIAEGQVNPKEEPFASMVLIGPEHVESGTGRLRYTESASDQGAESGKYLCKQGDVVYSKIRPALAKVVLAPEICLCSADMYPLDCCGFLRNHYLFWLLLSKQFTAWSVLESDRVAMPKINRDTFSELWIPSPPEPEQTAILNICNPR